MRCSSTAAAVIAAMAITQAVAGPTHRHAHAHAKRDWKDVDYTKLDYSSVDWSKMDWASILGGKKPDAATNPAPAPAASTETVTTESTDDSSYNASENTSDDGGNIISDVLSSINDDISDLWEGLTGFANNIPESAGFGSSTKSSGDMGDFYVGNVGSPYGHNMLKVSSEKGYDYTVNFVNTQQVGITMVVWNKCGKDGSPLSGGSSATKTPSLTFYLKPGANQIVAFDNDSQIGFAQATNDIAPSGHFATSFGECNMTPNGPTCNLSAILNKIFQDSDMTKPYDMSISNAENDCVSDPKQNSWQKEAGNPGATLNGLDGKDRNGSCYIYGKKGHFTAKMGGQE